MYASTAQKQNALYGHRSNGGRDKNRVRITVAVYKNKMLSYCRETALQDAL